MPPHHELPFTIETFTGWVNLRADIYIGFHARPAKLFLASVITPALDALDSEIKELEARQDAAAVFGVQDVRDLRSSTSLAFALSLQSLWELQLRKYLKDCAHELHRNQTYIKDLERGPWTQLVKAFGELRGFPLEAFDSYRYLDLLQTLGNVCRHGDGPSAKRLYELNPELWPNWPLTPIDFPGAPPPSAPSKYPPFSLLILPRSVLATLANAVTWFWDDHNYIYINNLKDKHASVEESLKQMRDERARRKW